MFVKINFIVFLRKLKNKEAGRFKKKIQEVLRKRLQQKEKKKESLLLEANCVAERKRC